MPEQAAAVGRIVHYVSHGTPGGEYGKQCRAAVVAEVGVWLTVATTAAEPTEASGGRPVRRVEQWFYEDACSLAVQNPTGVFFNDCRYDDGAGQAGDPDCPNIEFHDTHRYCMCGWTKAAYPAGTWHWPERV